MKNKVLLFDTSTPVCSIAIADEKNVMGEITSYTSKTHTVQLWKNLEELQNSLEFKKQEISTIVVGSGPGSFTGLRVGIAAAKSLALALNAELFSVSSLDIIANRIKDDSRLIFSLIDAKKKEIYFACYTNKYNGNLVRRSKFLVAKPEHMIGYIKKESILIGTGALAYREYFINETIEEVIIPESKSYHHINMHFLFDLYKAGLTQKVELEKFEPFYIRKSDAIMSKV